jgi:AP2-associated kinase
VSAILDDSSDDEGPEDPDHIASNVGFLRAIESDNAGKKKSRRSSSGSKAHRKSLPSISLSGTKNILAGKFGDAFRRFEGHSSASQDPRSPSPPHDDEPVRGRVLTPIAGSEATGTSGHSDDEYAIDETQELSPEVRRELERRRLSQEEKRVAAAAAEYKLRLQQGAQAPANKGAAIQNRVKELLDGTKEIQASRTAEGYGRFTDVTTTGDRPPIARKPVAAGNAATVRPMPNPAIASFTGYGAPASTPAMTHRTGPRVAPKPRNLRTGGGDVENSGGRSQQEEEDWEAKFSKKYPSLSGLEMVEADIRPTMRVKDV